MTTPRWAFTDPSDYPVTIYDAGHVLFRIHQAANGPLYFSRSDAGRWDPPISARSDFGTCYLAESAIAAYLEVFARTIPIRESQIDARVLSEVHLRRPLRLADLTNPVMAGRIGAIPELSVGPSYSDSQHLANRLHDAGLDGIRYAARHDPTTASRSVAIFSDAEDTLTIVKTMPIPSHIIEAGEQDFELFVMPDGPLY